MDLKGYKQLREAYGQIEENRNANAAALAAARKSAAQAAKTSSGAGQGVGADRRAARGSSYKAPTAKPTPAAAKPEPKASAPAPKPTPAAKPQPQAAAPKKAPVKQTGDKAKDMGTWAKANPKLAAKVKSKPAAPKPQASSGSSGSTGSSRLDKALSGIKKFEEQALADSPAANVVSASAPDAKEAFPKDRVERAKKQAPQSTKKEEVEVDSFDVILEYLTDKGFPQEDALQLMATMDDEKREKITSEAVSWDKYGRPKDPKKRAEAQRKAAEMRAKDKAAGRSRYGSKLGYDKKENDE